MPRRLLFTCLLLLVAAASFAAKTTEFFVVAHPDDWQLFMGVDAYNAMNDSNRHVVFIHVTAGDASYDAPQADRRFYMSRERGAIAALEFCMDIERYHTREYMDTILVEGHSIVKFEYKNVVDYFLRLPDGCLGAGLHGQSLEYLHDGRISTIASVDSMAVYHGWGDLVKTVRTIMETESAGSYTTGLSAPDIERAYNPGDHPDHIYSGGLALDAAATFDNMWMHFYVDYHTEQMPVNLSPKEIALKSAIYGVVEYCRSQSGTSNSWCDGHLNFLCRQYYRTIGSRIDSTLHGAAATGQATLYPNPARDAVNIIYHVAQPGTVVISVTAINGQAALRPVTLQKDSGDYSTRLEITALAQGNYIATLQLPGYRQSFPFTKL